MKRILVLLACASVALAGCEAGARAVFRVVASELEDSVCVADSVAVEGDELEVCQCEEGTRRGKGHHKNCHQHGGDGG